MQYSKQRIATIVRILDKIADHFDLQGAFGRPANAGGCANICKREDGKTVYCAVGALLTDEERDRDTDAIVTSLHADTLPALYRRNADGEYLADVHLHTREGFEKFLTSVQLFHDCYSSPIMVAGKDTEVYEKYRVAQFTMGIRRLADIFRIEGANPDIRGREDAEHFSKYHLPHDGLTNMTRVYDAAINFARLR